MYPPAIYDAIVVRPRLWNLHVEGAWDGFTFVGNIVPWITNVEMGALDIGWQSDGAQDAIHLKGWTNGVFGAMTTGGQLAVYEDGNTIAWQIGRTDGLNASDALLFRSRLVITSNASNANTPSQYENISMNGANARIEIAGGQQQFTGLVDGTSTTTATCPLNVTGGDTAINGVYMSIGGSTAWGCMSGGKLVVNSGFFYVGYGSSPVFSQTGGLMDISGNFWVPAPSMTAPFISATGGQTIVTGNTANPTTSGYTAVSITADNLGSVVANNQFTGYAYSVPAWPTTGYYQTTSLLVAQDSATVPAVRIGTNVGNTNYIDFSGGRGMFGYDVGGSPAISGGAGKGFEVYVNGTTGSFLSGTKALSINSAGVVTIPQLTGTTVSATQDSATIAGMTIGSGLSAANFMSISGGRGMFGLDNSGSVDITTGSGKPFAVYVNGTIGSPATGTKAIASDISGNVTIPGTLGITLSTPATSGATCVAGQITADASYVYVCTATNTWKRAALSSF